MRILMLAQFYAPIIGGEEQHVRTLSIELAARGHDVAVATLWHTGVPEFEIDQGVRVYRIRGAMQRAPGLFSESGRQHVPPFPDPGLTWELRRVMARERPEVVHGHNWLVRSFLPLKTRGGPRLVLSLHDYSLVCAKKVLLYHGGPCSGPGLVKCFECAGDHFGRLKGGPTVIGNWATAQVDKRLVDLYVPVSQAVAVANGLVDAGLPYQVLPNFLPDGMAQAHADADDYLKLLPAGEFLMFAGDLIRFKGIDVLLQAYAGLRGDTIPPLVMIGRMTADTPAQIPDNVRILDRWPHDALLEAWRRCSVGVLPSIGPETFGIVLLEAMAYGRPVVASRIGGMTDVVADGETGFLVTPGDADGLRQAIQRLIDEPGLKQRMGNAARLRLANLFSASSVVPRFEAMYRQVLGEPPPRQPQPGGAAAHRT
jgi:glycosyltransferase involved in cell wall biosynthesis